MKTHLQTTGFATDKGIRTSKDPKTGEILFNSDDINAYLVAIAEECAEDCITKLKSLREKADEENDLIGLQLEHVAKWSSKARTIKADLIETLRNLRMTAGGEINKITEDLEHVRAFFLSEKHDEELERLREFVAVLEKLQKFKDSGFLDAVTDTILKLDE